MTDRDPRGPHVDVYPSAVLNARPWLMFCWHHEPAPGTGNMWRGIVADCPTRDDAEQLARAHAATHTPPLAVVVEGSSRANDQPM